jgi:hypothetical protein
MGWGSTDGIGWSDTASVGGRDCAELLDSGKRGLDWLHRAICRYQEAAAHGLLSPLWVAGRGFTDDASIDTLYYAEKDINTVVLGAKADDLGRALGGADAQSGVDALLAAQAAAVRALPDAWNDSPVADVAAERLRAFADYAAQQVAAVRAVQTQLSAAATAICGFVKTKAAFVKGFDCAPDGRLWVAGHSMRLPGPRPGDDPVCWIIYGAQRNLGANHSGFDVAARTYDQIRGQFPDLPERPTESAVTDTMFDAAEGICKEWVQQHFGPAVQNAVSEFVNQCALCEQGIQGVYDTVRQAFDAVRPDRFPQPGFVGPPALPLPAGPDRTDPPVGVAPGRQREPAAEPAAGLAPAPLGGGLAPRAAEGIAVAELGAQVLGPLIADVGQIAQQAGEWQAGPDPSPLGVDQAPEGTVAQPGEVQPHPDPPDPDPPRPPHAELPHSAHPPTSGAPAIGAPITAHDSGGLSARQFPAGAPAGSDRPGPTTAAAMRAGVQADEITAVPVHPMPSRMVAQPAKTAAPARPDTDDTGGDPASTRGARLWDSEPL